MTLRSQATGELAVVGAVPACPALDRIDNPPDDLLGHRSFAIRQRDPSGASQPDDPDQRTFATRSIEPNEIVVGRHGLVIVRGNSSGLLLPEVPAIYGLQTVEDYLAALYRKAHIPREPSPDFVDELYAFETNRGVRTTTTSRGVSPGQALYPRSVRGRRDDHPDRSDYGYF